MSYSVQGMVRYDFDNVGQLILKGIINGRLQTVLSPAYPYAFVERKSGVVNVLSSIEEVINWEEVDLKASDTGMEVIKFFTKNPKHIPVVREKLNDAGYKTYESDIPFIRRLLHDKKLIIDYDRSNIAYLDIEVDDSKSFPSEYGKYEIVSVAVYDGNGNGEWFFVDNYNDEVEMLGDMVAYLMEKEMTVIVGWNVQFDYNHLLERLRMKKMFWELEWLRHCNVIDLMHEYMFAVKGLSSYSLEEVSRHEGWKIKHKSKAIHEMRKMPKELEEYNMYDSELLYMIDKKYGFTDVKFEIARQTNLTLDILTQSRIGDALIIWRLRELGYVAIDKVKKQKEKYKGAFVIEPQPGLYKYVGYYDVNSLYPNVIIHKNIDIDGFNGEVMPYIERQLLEDRAKYKKLYKETGNPKYNVMQNAKKILANGLYGLFGSPSFRYYNREKAEAITTGGREVLMRMKTFIENDLALKVLYGDSVTKDTRVRYYTLSGNERVEAIEDLWNRYSKYAKVRPDGKEEIYLKNMHLLTYAVSDDLKVGLKEIVRVVRHKVKKKIYEIVTESGKSVKVTEDHSVMVLSNNGQGLVIKKPKDLSINVDMLLVKSNSGRGSSSFERVVKVKEVTDYIGYVYDLEVEEYHTFFANDILVHNTDSMFCHLGIAFDNEIEPDINAVVQFAEFVKDEINKEIAPFQVKLECVLTGMLFLKGGDRGGAKKRYVGLKTTGEYIVRGLEVRRSDWSELSKEVLWKVIDLILKEGKTKKDVMKYLGEVKRKLYSGEYNDKIVMAKSLSKRISEYSNAPPHVRAYVKAKEKGYDFAGQKVTFVWVKGGDVEPVYPGVDLSKIPVDYDAIWEKQIMAPVKRILDSIGAGRNMKLDVFFKMNKKS